ncbi:hypothetical protein GALL_472950 [mine drainage metagenome]|uniref:Uncharacterized protein n=1 Tax=mine drainage metagenome TaxID=410659 RepID=A0A1J5PTM4_9ZZZZ
MGREPISICQAVNDSRSISGARWCRRLARITASAQLTPAITASPLLFRLPCRCQGSRMQISPLIEASAASHCMPRIFSPSMGHARTITQNGMV